MPLHDSIPYEDLRETGLMDHATEATDAFLNHDIPLNDSIQKIASREDLSTHEIERVVEESNKVAYLALRPKMAAENKPVFEFDLADRDAILDSLQKNASYLPSPSRGWSSSHVDEAPVTKTAHDMWVDTLGEMQVELGTPKQITERLLANKELEREKLAQDLFATQLAIKNTRDSFVKTAKNMVLQDGIPLDKLATALLAACPDAGDVLGVLLGDVRAICGIPPGSVKVAAPFQGQMNHALTISGQPVLMINGTHKLVMDLDTLVDQSDSHRNFQNGIYKVDDDVTYLRKNLRNMQSQESSKPPHIFDRLDRQPVRDESMGTYGE